MIMPPPLKLRLRGYSGNETAVDTSLDATATHVPPKSSSQKSKQFREKLKMDPERYAAFCEKDASRSRNRRKHMTEEQRVHYNNMCKLRMRKKREKDREKKKNKTTSRETRAAMKRKNERRERDKLRKQLKRASMTAEERATVNKNRREKRLRKQLELQQMRLQRREHALRIEQLQQERRQLQEKIREEKKAEEEVTKIVDEQDTINRRKSQSRRKAIQRARAGLPKSPSKFANTISAVIRSASPKKRKALEDQGVGSMNEVEKVFAESVAEEMRSRKKKRSTRDLNWKRSFVPLIEKMKQQNMKKRACKYFSTSSKSIKKANNILKKKSKKDQALKNKVVRFYEMVSVTLPDKKLISKRTLKKKAFLQRPIRTLFKNFKAENPTVKICLTKFVALRPRHIKPVRCMKYQGCLCTYCCNVDLKVTALNKLANSYSMRSMFEGSHGVSNATMCPKGTEKYHNRSCIQRKCNKCGVYLLRDQLSPLIQQHDGKEMSWRKWERKTVNTGGKDVVRQVLTIKTGTVEDLIAELQDEVDPLSLHLFHATWQHRQYCHLKSSLPNGWVLMVADFAENFTCRNQQEIQSAHWSHNTVTIHPIVCTYHCLKCDQLMDESLVFISEDGKHDYHAVNSFMCSSVEYLVNKLVDVQQVIRFSDGAACQYKSKGPFTDVAMAEKIYRVPTSFHFYGSRHGKGASDGESAVVKRSASQAVLGRSVVINTAEDLYLQCKEIARTDDGTEGCLHFQRRIFLVEKIERNRGHENADIKTLKGTRSLHAIRGSPEGQVWTRNLSCFCDPCLSGQYQDCMNKEYVEDWKESIIFTRAPKIPVTDEAPEAESSDVPDPAPSSDVSDPAATSDLPREAEFSDVPDPARSSDVSDPAATSDLPREAEFSDVPDPALSSDASDPAASVDVPREAEFSDVPDPAPSSDVSDPAATSDLPREAEFSDMSDPAPSSNVANPAASSNVPKQAVCSSVLPKAATSLDLPSAGEFVVIAVQGKQRKVPYVAKVLEADREHAEVKVSYLEQLSTSAFTMPTVADAVYWHPLTDVVSSMGVPFVTGTGSRLKLIFKDTSPLRSYNIEQ